VSSRTLANTGLQVRSMTPEEGSCLNSIFVIKCDGAEMVGNVGSQFALPSSSSADRRARAS
jgi:hypothetical protein